MSDQSNQGNPGQSDQPPADQPAYGQQPPTYGQPPAYGQYSDQSQVAAGAMSPASERTWSSAAHWSALVASFIGLSLLGPLIVMLTKGNESPLVRRHAVESLNFQISITIYMIVSAILILVLIGFLLIFAVLAVWLVCTILGAIKASNGEEYRYPMTLRLVS